MSARFPSDEQNFTLHLSRYKKAVAASLFNEASTKDDFRIAVESVTPQAAAEIAVNFKVQVPDDNAPSVASSPSVAVPVLAKMTVSALNPKFTALGLVDALDVTGAKICGNATTSTTPPPTSPPPAPPPPAS